MVSSILQTLQSVPGSVQITALCCGAIGIYLTFRLRTRLLASSVPAAMGVGVSDSVDDFPDDSRDYKMVIVVRTDINMSRGKAAAQCCHAVLEVYKEALARYPKVVGRWEHSGQPKVTLKVDSESELYRWSAWLYFR